ncbi:cation-translocating P-type ATPase [Catenulispora sp. NF23]|uniref:cation-translocating P-type ATPase n=1 Tax=Catenulispora pinistramenti TaxID=2705254 RepID=UPI001BA7CFBE|nr:cation-translocating P-type ATPase [Catenulispora pinistramenti]MBS2537725.1 cation-translocating P-type ATPase [Catenulispora pinistramenti]
MDRVAVGAVRFAAASTMGAVDAVGTLASGSLGAVEAVAGFAATGPTRAGRRVWSADGRAHVEVKGLTGSGARHHALRTHLTGALRELKGVRWAEINAVTQHILIDFDEQELDVEAILEVIEAAEEAHDTDEETFSRAKPEHPSADAPVNMAVIALAADAVGLSVAVAGRVMRLPAVPQALRVPLLIAETTPRIRHLVEDRIGRTHTEALFAVSNSTLNALAQGPEPILIDSTHHALRFAEARARQAVWRRRERELVGDGSGLPSEVPRRSVRPVPLPEGPVEKLGDRAALASLLGAGGVLAATRDPGRAGDLMLATMPKAARLGREAFASMLDWELSRHGVVPMDVSSLRRLDRISLVAIDSSTLCTDRPRILSAVATDPATTDREIWAATEQALIASSIASSSTSSTSSTSSASSTSRFVGSGPWTVGEWSFEKPQDALDGTIGGPVALTLDVLDPEGTRRGRVRIGVETDPLADALLAAARDAASHVVLTEHDSVSDLLPWADEVVAPGAPLLDYIRLMQLGGSGVLAISGTDDEALHAADIGVAVVAEGRPVCWSAELLCGPGLSQPWRVLRSVGTARQVSERSARLALGGSALGALLAVTGRRRTARPLTLSPVHSAMAAAIFGGTLSALRVARQSPPEPSIRGNWHDLTAREAFDRVERARREQPAEVAPRGRFAAVADAGRETARMFGGLPLASQTAQLVGAVAEELRDPLTPVLALGAAASAIVGSGVDALLVTGVMAGNAVISGAQRMRAEQALRRLLMGEQILAHQVQWQPADSGSGAGWLAGLDDASALDVPATTLRVGDVIKLAATDVVPADVRLLTALDLEVDESSLNGESLPVAKLPAATPGADLDERACMLYEGCTILAGSCYALVVAVGQDTESGRAAAVAGSAPPPAGIQARLAELTRIALPAAGVGGIAVTGLSGLRGVPLPRAVASGVAVAVAAVPEGLPLVATVAQLAAARRLSQRGVLVRSSRTLEALGRVDTVCFDKTGTLTQGKLSVTRLADLDGDLPLDSEEGSRLLRFAARACPAVEEGAARRLAHATDGAVVEAAHRHLGRDEKWNLISELPFETTRGYAASIGTNSTRLTLAVKGAPETVLEACTQVRSRDGGINTLSAARRREAVEATIRLTRKGLRVLAIAESHPVVENIEDVAELDVATLVTDLTLIGFIAIADTPRPTSERAVADLTAAGVRVTMITGDHPNTAVAIAEQLGIPEAQLVLTGAEFDRLSKRERAERVTGTTVFARVSPEQKVRVVQALREAGRIVAMTGDGANDAAAIRLADVGIAIAGHGSAAARAAADLVLAEPDPARITDALREGRTLWGNVRDAASILVGGNAGEVAFTVLGTAISGRAPLGTRQLLLVNMLTDMLPALAVALAPARPNSGEDPLASGPVSDLWDSEFKRTLAVRGGATALGAGLAWGIGRVSGRPRRAETMGLGALVGTQLGQTLLTARHSPLVIATAAVSAVALIAVVETPGVSQFFGCTPLGPMAWGTVLASAATATATGVVAPRMLERVGWKA